ncbi:MAG: polysulfide reductase NrfD [Planctomycetes bacterium]|nr:polysulfide reductase NrfD [Planctomycetota bacterium]
MKWKERFPGATFPAAAICGLIFVAGVAAGIYGFIRGHEEVYNTTREIPWGILISTYVFFVVGSTGVCLVTSIGHVFGQSALVPIAKRSLILSIALILSGFLVMAGELEDPIRMAIYFVASPNLNSMILLMGVFYGIYIAFMVGDVGSLLRGKKQLASCFGLGAVVMGVVAHSNLGAVFGNLPGRAYWAGAYTPVYFIASALATGGAAILVSEIVFGLVRRDGMTEERKRAVVAIAKLEILFLFILLFFEAWKIIASLWGQPPGRYEIVRELIAGRFQTMYWLGLVLEFGVPIVLLLLLGRRGNSGALALAGLSCLAGIFIVRYEFVILGQIIPPQRLMGAASEPFLHYTPSAIELAIVAAGFGMCGLLVFVSEALFLSPRRKAVEPAVDAAAGEAAPGAG